MTKGESGKPTRSDAGRPRPSVPAAPILSPRPERWGFGSILARWDDPLSWSITIGRFAGYRLGLHWTIVFWGVAELLLSLPKDAVGPLFVLQALGATAIVLTAREAARLWVCSALGGEAEYVAIWPLGAISGPTMPRGVRRRLVILGAPAVVHGAIAAASGLALTAMGSGASLAFHPLDPAATLRGFFSPWVSALWWLYYVNAVVFLINLAPMLPLDGGRAMEAVLTPRGQVGGVRTTAIVGLLFAGAAAVYAATQDLTRVLAVALVGGLACWLELRRSEFVLEPSLVPEPGLGRGEAGEPGLSSDAEPERSSDQEPEASPRAGGKPESGPVRALRSEAEEERELDRVLSKISQSGMASLTDEERRVLDAATAARRGGPVRPSGSDGVGPAGA